MEIDKEKMYRRGIDYPPYWANKDGTNVKMHLAMPGKELLKWFTEKELTKKGYPHPEAYHGSLP